MKSILTICEISLIIMKNLRRYLTDSVKTCERSSVNSEEVIKERGKVDDGPDSGCTPRKKRTRVKIKITQRNSEGRVCDIIENNSDLVDKTPSPFSKVDNENLKSSRTDTPKRSVPGDISAKSKSSNSTSKKNNLVDVTSSYSNDRNSMECEIETVRLDKNEGDDVISNSDERVESNAFDVLMTRNKPVELNPPPQLSPQEAEHLAKKGEETKTKLKQNKEKLTSLADKKGYAKRKLAELEESERIEKRIHNRTKMFKQEAKKDSSEIVNSSTGQRQNTHNLLNYFSKTAPEQKKIDATMSSTIVVTADIHTPHVNTSTPILPKNSSGTVENSKRKKLKSRNFVSNVDDIKLLRSEITDPNSSPEEVQGELIRNKPKWSLRIKLQSHDKETSASEIEDMSDEAMFLPRNNEKTRRKLSLRKTGKVLITSTTDSTTESREIKRNSRTTSESIKKNERSNDTKLNMKKKFDSKMEKIEEIDVSIVTIDSDTAEQENGKVSKENVPKINSQDNFSKSNSQENYPKREKLAPLFTKCRKPDPAVLAARRSFLQSNLIENNKRPHKKSDSNDPRSLPILPFPKISHVTQLTDEMEYENINYSNVRINSSSKYEPVLDVTQFQFVVGPKSSTYELESANQEIKADPNDILKEIEERCSDARNMWDKIVPTNNEEPKQRSLRGQNRKRRSNDKKESKQKEETDKVNSVWTYKYKPTSSKEVVGNEDAAVKLKNWLDSWKLSLPTDGCDSEDDFYSSDCSYISRRDNDQVAILLGPHGSGKTASVYAVAEELGYSVLEVNASTKRTGKKILKEFQEATKSHRIKKDSTQSTLISTMKETMKKIPQKSLILVEDVDLIFEEDEGFISATFQLASNTKRPIVMTCGNTCVHLNKLAPQQLRIYFQPATGKRVSAHLELISLAETGHKLPQDCLELLEQGDLRKALLQLQYLLLSGNPRMTSLSATHDTLWQDMRYCIYKPAVKAGKKKPKNITDVKVSHSNRHDETVLNNLADNLDRISLLSSLTEVQDPTEASVNLIAPCLSLVDDIEPYSSLNDLSTEIADWLNQKVLHKETLLNASKASVRQIGSQLSIKRQVATGVSIALSHVVQFSLERRAMYVDYLPSIRTICRAEHIRSTNNEKRSRRFFHYLQNFNLPSASTKPNILAMACKSLQEKTVKSKQE
ncbi:ATPase family AAA domain-containing protein 5 isoform X2 [Cephus cinctus]|uniref:ATPase family AAA domain-containing protein 5 isoform X2 n=1 Tax=Cephus cinctus TaxID=211228 RepID=A0AAJ7RD51_CEPCN|nr:ATPase family AAA domain-containing protein 5 isoform X2 [Cephus cinctus]